MPSVIGNSETKRDEPVLNSKIMRAMILSGYIVLDKDIVLLV